MIDNTLSSCYGELFHLLVRNGTDLANAFPISCYDITPMGDQSTEAPKETSSEIVFCATRQQLLDFYWEAMQQLTMLQDQQVAAMIGGGEVTSFDLLIYTAQERKNQAKDDYLVHTEKHRC